MSDESGPVDRLRENATEVASTVVTGIWLAALFADFEYWLPLLIVGYVVVVPLVEILAGDAEEEPEAAEDDAAAQADGADDASTTHGPDRSGDATDADAALEALRERYARGELTEAQFERKLERLLETETVEDAEADRARADAEAERAQADAERALDRERES